MSTLAEEKTKSAGAPNLWSRESFPVGFFAGAALLLLVVVGANFVPILLKNGDEYVVESLQIYTPEKGYNRAVYVLRPREDDLGRNQFLYEERYTGAADGFSPREIVTFRGFSMKRAYKRLDKFGQAVVF